jgi:hypothetical protein
MDSKEFDFEAFKKEAIAGMYAGSMYAGKPLNRDKGTFAPLVRTIYSGLK